MDADKVTDIPIVAHENYASLCNGYSSQTAPTNVQDNTHRADEGHFIPDDYSHNDPNADYRANMVQYGHNMNVNEAFPDSNVFPVSVTTEIMEAASELRDHVGANEDRPSFMSSSPPALPSYHAAAVSRNSSRDSSRDGSVASDSGVSSEQGENGPTRRSYINAPVLDATVASKPEDNAPGLRYEPDYSFVSSMDATKPSSSGDNTLVGADASLVFGGEHVNINVDVPRNPSPAIQATVIDAPLKPVPAIDDDSFQNLSAVDIVIPHSALNETEEIPNNFGDVSRIVDVAVNAVTGQHPDPPAPCYAAPESSEDAAATSMVPTEDKWNHSFPSNSDCPAIDSEIENVTENKIDKPIAESQIDEPASESKTDKPVPESQVDKPAAESQGDKPAAESQMDKPAAESQVDKPVAESQVDKAATDSSNIGSNDADTTIQSVDTDSKMQNVSEISNGNVVTDNKFDNAATGDSIENVTTDSKMDIAAAECKKDGSSVVEAMPPDTASAQVSADDKLDATISTDAGAPPESAVGERPVFSLSEDDYTTAMAQAEAELAAMEQEIAQLQAQGVQLPTTAAAAQQTSGQAEVVSGQIVQSANDAAGAVPSTQESCTPSVITAVSSDTSLDTAEKRRDSGSSMERFLAPAIMSPGISTPMDDPGFSKVPGYQPVLASTVEESSAEKIPPVTDASNTSDDATPKRSRPNSLLGLSKPDLPAARVIEDPHVPSDLLSNLQISNVSTVQPPSQSNVSLDSSAQNNADHSALLRHKDQTVSSIDVMSSSGHVMDAGGTTAAGVQRPQSWSAQSSLPTDAHKQRRPNSLDIAARGAEVEPVAPDAASVVSSEPGLAVTDVSQQDMAELRGVGAGEQVADDARTPAVLGQQPVAPSSAGGGECYCCCLL